MGFEFHHITPGQVHHARVETEALRELAVTDLDGIYPSCAVGKQAVREAPACRAHIEGTAAWHSNSKGRERFLELLPAAGGVTVPPPEPDLSIRLHLGARLVNQSALDNHCSGPDDALGLL